MDDSGPAVRASLMKTALATLDRCGAEGIDVRGALDDATLTKVECAGPLAWLPIRLNVELVHAVADTLGEERFKTFVQELIRSTYAGSGIHRLVRAVVGVLGIDPGSFARLVPHAYGLLFRACGRWRIERVGELVDGSEAVSTMILEDLPEVCVQDRVWLESVACSLFALLVVAEVEGSVVLDTVDEANRTARFRLSWVAAA